MCQFCHTHGDGKKWYLNAENYSEELLDNLERRHYFQEFLPQYGQTWNGAKFEARFPKGLSISGLAAPD